MRYATLVTLFLALGAAVLAATPEVDGQEKELPPLKAPFTERVTYRLWTPADNKFLPPQKVDAYRKEVKGVQKFYLRAAGFKGGTPLPGSEIVDAEGVAWTVTKASNADVYICEVVKQPAPKKKATAKATRTD